MNQVLEIRTALNLSQSEFGRRLGMTQGNVSFYEKGQKVPPDVAGKLIDMAKKEGLEITYDHVYGALPIPSVVGVVGNLVSPIKGVEGAGDALGQNNGDTGGIPVIVAHEESGLSDAVSGGHGGDIGSAAASGHVGSVD